MNAFTQPATALLVEKMSNEEYHSRAEFSSSQLKHMLRSGAHFYSYNILKEHEKESKKHLDFGTLAHTLFLEPEQFNHEFVVIPDSAPKPPTDAMRNAKKPSDDSIARIEWWDNFNAENGKKTVITQEQLNFAQRICNNLMTLSIAKDMQALSGLAETSIFFTDETYNLSLRIRPDFHIAPCDKYPNGLIIDLKTTIDARPQAFQRTCGNFNYDLSAAMYREGFQAYYNTEDKPPFVFLVAENTMPFNVKQYKASEVFLATGESRYNKAKELLAESVLIDEWHGYSPDLEEVNLPHYVMNQILSESN